jgi:enoyl-CoA hydratase/carnithine racemase
MPHPSPPLAAAAPPAARDFNTFNVIHGPHGGAPPRRTRVANPALVTVERPREGVALITLANPAIGNFGSWEAIDALARGLREAREGGARASVIASGVPGHWIEHAWLPDLEATLCGKHASGSPASWFLALQELAHVEVVTIAAIAGDCSGGGAELGWACDLRIAEEQARFSQPEVMIGVATGIGGTSRLVRLVGRTAAAEMVLDGAPVGAQRLHQLGAVNRVVAAGEAVPEALAWAERIAARPRHSLAALKRMLNDAENLPLGEALANEQRIFQETARRPEALEGMRRTQARFDAGETPRDVYGPPRD